MNRFQQTFERLKAENRKGLVGYMTAGDPDLERSEQNIRTALTNGVDVLELGMPFSDPTADGPTIQAASQRSLASGTTLEGVLEMVRRLRADFETPIVLFGYTNPLFRYGYERICKDAATAGIDGLLVVDLPFEERDELKDHMDRQGLCFIPLVAPTTPAGRAAEIVRDIEGFVYYIMVTGVTGARDTVAADVDAHIAKLRECTDLPIAVGFGVSSGEQARRAGKLADAVVVGSALISAAQDGTLANLARELSDALR